LNIPNRHEPRGLGLIARTSKVAETVSGGLGTIRWHLAVVFLRSQRKPDEPAREISRAGFSFSLSMKRLEPNAASV